MLQVDPALLWQLPNGREGARPWSGPARETVPLVHGSWLCMNHSSKLLSIMTRPRSLIEHGADVIAHEAKEQEMAATVRQSIPGRS